MPDFFKWTLIVLNVAQIPLLLFLPLRAKVFLKLFPEGGRTRVQFRFALIKKTFHFRIDLLQQPYLTVSLLRADGGLRKLICVGEKKKKKRKKRIWEFNVMDLLTHMHIKDCRLALKLGLGDAAPTALLAGAAENALSDISKVVLNGKLSMMRVEVEPDFDDAGVSLEAECMVSTTFAKIISIFIPKLRKKGESIYVPSN